MKKYLIISIFLLLSAIWFEPASAAFIQSVTVVPPATATSVTLTYTPTLGDSIYLYEAQGGSASNGSNLTPTDSGGQTYQLAYQASDTLSGATGFLSIYFVTSTAVTATTTCKFNIAVNSPVCIIMEFSGMDKTNSAFDNGVNNPGNTNTVSTSSAITTNSASEVLLFGSRQSANQNTYTAQGGFTIPATGATSTRGVMSYNIVPSIQTAATTSVTYNSATNYFNFLVGFRIAATGSGEGATIATVQGVTVRGVTIL